MSDTGGTSRGEQPDWIDPIAEVSDSALSRRGKRAQAIIDSLPGLFFHYDSSMRLVDWNDRFERLTGLTGDALVEADPFQFVHGRSAATVQGALEHLAVQRTIRGETEVFDAERGAPVPFFFSVTRVDDDAGPGFLGIAVDVSNLKSARESLERESAFLSAVLESSRDGFVVFGTDGEVLFHNRRYLEFWNVTPQGLRSMSIDGRRAFFAQSTIDPVGYRDMFVTLNEDPDSVLEVEFRLVSDVVLECYAAPVRDRAGRALGRIWVFRDITRRRIAESQSEFYATHDDITGLFNRDALLALVTDRFRSADGSPFGLITIDMRQFKVVIATFGHAFGDRLLHEIGQRLEERLEERLGGRGSLARSNGDEFLVLVPDTRDHAGVVALAEDLLETVKGITHFEGRHVFLRARAGVAVAPEHGTDASQLALHADLAKTYAKEHFDVELQLYHDAIGAAVERRIALEQQLRTSLGTDAYSLAFQPIYEVASGAVVACEALLRWHSDEFGAVSPAEFIPVAENSGLIIELGVWVLREACRQAAAWPSIDGRQLKVAVNISAAQFLQSDFVETVEMVLRETGLDAQLLELELTESIFATDRNAISQAVSRLRALGIAVALDDFGTEYSSLAYLKHFDFSVLKIDRTFIGNIGTSSADEAIVRSVIQMADSLGYVAVAEGVETAEQYEFLRSIGCSRAQGYLLSKPLTPLELPSALTNVPVTPV